MPSLLPPPPMGMPLDDPTWGQFYELLRKLVNNPVFYSRATDPTLQDIPNGSWSLWSNSTSGVLKLWANDTGTLKSVTLT